eukprot:scaffold118243_cov59-Cyclotella_meneghiniana.AAC.2
MMMIHYNLNPRMDSLQLLHTTCQVMFNGTIPITQQRMDMMRWDTNGWKMYSLTVVEEKNLCIIRLDGDGDVRSKQDLILQFDLI